jgi:hypothetical protein
MRGNERVEAGLFFYSALDGSEGWLGKSVYIKSEVPVVAGVSTTTSFVEDEKRIGRQ